MNDQACFRIAADLGFYTAMSLSTAKMRLICLSVINFALGLSSALCPSCANAQCGNLLCKVVCLLLFTNIILHSLGLSSSEEIREKRKAAKGKAIGSAS